MRADGRHNELSFRAVVIYASQDRDLARRLVQHLRAHRIGAWWAEGDLTHGQWEASVVEQIEQSDALVPLVSPHTHLHKIFTDEWSYAEENGKAIFPVVFDKASIPLGKRGYSHTLAADFSSESEVFEALTDKLSRHAGGVRTNQNRPREISVGSKLFSLPSFVFSLSSFETQLHPLDGLQLLNSLPEAACLVSAYDVHDGPKAYRSLLAPIVESPKGLVFLDSGNYEATRKSAYATSVKTDGWQAQHFWDVAATAPWDLVFSYDHPPPRGPINQVVETVLDAYFRDMLHTGLSREVLCPIVHATAANGVTEAAALVLQVARAIRPTLIAIPERELGDGLLQRMKAIRAIRSALDTLPWYQPLHVLGTGNPTTIAALAVCGADTFDGLEWCRTAANYESNSLMHFQQFDVLKAVFAGRMTSDVARNFAELPSIPFSLRAASYNFDYFTNWLRLIQRSAHSGNPEAIFQGIPLVGTELSREYLNGTSRA